MGHPSLAESGFRSLPAEAWTDQEAAFLGRDDRSNRLRGKRARWERATELTDTGTPR